MKRSGIYRIDSIIKPEKVYIGSAIDINDRWRCHLKDLRLNKHGNSRLQNHHNKYGELDLVFSIIEPCLPPFLTAREQHYINTLKPWFNICQIAGSSLGRKPSKESRLNMSEGQKGNKNGRGNKGKKGHPAVNKGQHHSEDAKQKMKKLRKGRKPALGKHWELSEETKHNMRIAWEKRRLTPVSEETREKLRISSTNPSEEVRQKMRKPKSEEHKQKLRESGKRFWDKVRLKETG